MSIIIISPSPHPQSLESREGDGIVLDVRSICLHYIYKYTLYFTALP